MSADGQHGIVVIALVGSPFSARYAADRTASPLRFAAMNVCVYGPRSSRFALTERTIDARAHDGIVIGKSSMRWDRGDLVIHLDERSAPWGAPIRGSIRVQPECAPGRAHLLDTAGEHRWWPVAPVAKIAVALDAPGLRFEGHGYHDANAGDVPLEKTFTRWSWSRARLGGDRAAVVYDCVDRHGEERRLGRIIGDRGARDLDIAAQWSLPATNWGLARTVRAHGPTRILRTLEDGPFYARSLLDTEIAGERVMAMHEELSCTRLSASWVRFLAGFRMRRA